MSSPYIVAFEDNLGISKIVRAPKAKMIRYTYHSSIKRWKPPRPRERWKSQCPGEHWKLRETC